MSADARHKTRTLWLAGMLHGFTHLYQVVLLPLYLPIQAEFQLAGKGQATLLVTVMMLAYFLPSYPMGVLADRFSRKKLLGWGLAVNALGFIGMSFAPNYATALGCMIVAGFGGSFFHPAATALIARLFPRATGKALGLIGIGAGAGFFVGPIYSGWRADQAGSWRAPLLDLGSLGLLGALLFFWLADEAPPDAAKKKEFAPAEKMFATPVLWIFFLAAAGAFSLRDFAGNSMGSLGSLFLQGAHGFSVRETGVALSAIFLAATISNPLFGHLSDRASMRWGGFVLTMAALVVALFPHLPDGWVHVALMAYGFFFMGSYPIVEGALMKAVHDSVRGRVFGLWITIGGLAGNFAHWLAGHWVENLGPRAHSPAGYFWIYGGVALLILLSLLGLPCLHAIRKREHPETSATPSAIRHSPSAIG